jgi:NAD(P)-dependent dehydrogenase (short-subunit alcohol dehydrogenase family)
VRLSRAVIPVMLQNTSTTSENEAGNGNEGGVIINISSTPAIAGYTEGSPYTIAKTANIALTKCIAREYGSNNIRAYSLALGNIATLATYGSMTEECRHQASQEPSIKRWGKPEEVAKIAACIASNNFSFATGNTIVIDSGTVLL